MRFSRAIVLIVLMTTLLAAGASPALAQIAIFPEQPTANDPIEVLVTVDCNCRANFDPPQITGDGRILLTGRGDDIPEPPVILPYIERIVLPPLPAGAYRLEVRYAGLTQTFDFQVAAADPFLRFPGARLSVKVDWKNPRDGTQGTGKPIVLTPESGYFYFFDWKNVELTVKLLDGRPVNGHWWLFIASMTTLEVKIEVTQCPPENLGIPCLTKTYVQPAGQNRNFVDTSTFSL